MQQQERVADIGADIDDDPDRRGAAAPHEALYLGKPVERVGLGHG